VLRPRRLAQDDTSSRDSNVFLLDYLAKQGERFDAVMVLQPTSPLRTAEDIRLAWQLFEEHAPCAVVSVCPLVPESWMGRIGRDGSFERFTGDSTVYRLNGAVYIHLYEDYLHDRPPRKTIAYPMPSLRSVDIDRKEDLDYARFLVRHDHATTCV
jgi:CMP-N-acetylneuraminic acid synthetase